MNQPPPDLRDATPSERTAWRLTGRWPDSYIAARLEWCDAYETWTQTATHEQLLDAIRATEEAP